jgi:steroid delta-isomerase-like uncharacterized protein
MPQTQIDVAKQQLEAFNDKNWDRVREVVAPNVVYDEVGTHRTINGVNDVVDAWKGWATAIPDSTASFDRATADGDTVTLEVTWRGTHTGPLQTPNGTIPPSGKPIEVRAAQVVEVADGKAKRIRHYFDMGTILHQIGVE